mmetsp:Transcript_2800/g.5166  ORF Transcript_2800/g.5166 Transcript_2800/m.5166 type:complete len:183 (+) Transcript_2800:111-659(+)
MMALGRRFRLEKRIVRENTRVNRSVKSVRDHLEEWELMRHVGCLWADHDDMVLGMRPEEREELPRSGGSEEWEGLGVEPNSLDGLRRRQRRGAEDQIPSPVVSASETSDFMSFAMIPVSLSPDASYEKLGVVRFSERVNVRVIGLDGCLVAQQVQDTDFSPKKTWTGDPIPRIRTRSIQGAR